MRNQNTAHLPATDAPLVTDLTTEQADQVAGGVLIVSSLLGGGCPGCTSGRLTAFVNLAALVNPAPEA
jgi:hypothetical protein